MAEPALPDVFAEAAKWVGGGGTVATLLVVLGQLARGWFTGSAQADRERRDEQRVDIKDLRDEVDRLKTQMSALQEEVTRLNAKYLHVYGGRAKARLTLNLLERCKHTAPKARWQAAMM